MNNPFLILEQRLDRIESLLLRLESESLKEIKEQIRPSEPQVVDAKQLLKYRPSVGSKSKLNKLTMEGKIPYYLNGGIRLFKLSEIDEWLLRKRVATVEERENKMIKRDAN